MRQIAALVRDYQLEQSWKVYTANMQWAIMNALAQGKATIKPYSQLIHGVEMEQAANRDKRTAGQIMSGLIDKLRKDVEQ